MQNRFLFYALGISVLAFAAGGLALWALSTSSGQGLMIEIRRDMGASGGPAGFSNLLSTLCFLGGIAYLVTALGGFLDMRKEKGDAAQAAPFKTRALGFSLGGVLLLALPMVPSSGDSSFWSHTAPLFFAVIAILAGPWVALIKRHGLTSPAFPKGLSVFCLLILFLLLFFFALGVIAQQIGMK